MTTSFLGWGHLQNGDLLRAAEEACFDVLVTGGRTLVREQDLSIRRISIIALSTNNWPIIKNFIPRILAAISAAAPGMYSEVDGGEFSRKRRTGKPGSAA